MSMKWDIILLWNTLENVHNYGIPMGEVEKLITIVEPMRNF